MWIKLLKAWGDHEVGVSLSLGSVEAQALIDDGTAEKVKTPESVSQATQAITTAVAQAVVQSLPALVEAEVTRVIGQAGGAPPPGSDVSDAHDLREDNPNGGFQTFSEFAVCVFQADKPGSRHQIDSRLEVLQQAATVSP